MSDLVGNHEDGFSQNEAHMLHVYVPLMRVGYLQLHITTNNFTSIITKYSHLLSYYLFILFIDAPTGTRAGVEEYEAMEVDTDGGPGPQRCK